MSNYICDIRCSYRQPSGYCGLTSGYETCQFRQLHQPNTVVGYVPPLKKTNADRIRAMSDDELADLLTADCKYIPEELCRKYLGNCDACLREWLKQEAQT